MSVLLTILVWVLLLLGGLLLVILLVPIHLSANGELADWNPDGQASIRWGWGFLAVSVAPKQGATLRFIGLRIYRFKLEKTEKKEKKEKPDKPTKKRKGIRWGWRNRRFFLRLVSAFHLRGGIWGTFGAGDPADTAHVTQQILRPLENRLSRFELCIEPNYLDEVLDVRGQLSSSIWPMEFVGVFLAAVVRGESRRVLFAKA